jgi:predicted TIM-barrel enzyme
MNIETARFNMIEQQIRPWEVLDGQVLSLLSVVKRENFVPLAHKALAFADKGRVLISLGVSEENALAVWDISQGLVLKSALIPGHATNQIIVDKSEIDTI